VLNRILLTLLFALLAVPAVAMPVMHGAPAEPVAQAHVGHHGIPGHDDPAKAQERPAFHGCIGCIAPGYGLGRTGRPVPFVASTDFAGFAAVPLVGALSVPEPPPPKVAV